MKQIVFASALLFATAAFAQTPNDCGHCAGVVMLADQIPGPVMPVLVTDVTTIGLNLQDASPDIVRRWTVLLHVNVKSGSDAHAQIDEQTREQIDWAARRGPFAAIGTILNVSDRALEAYAAQTAATMARAAKVAPRVVVRVSSLDELQQMVAAGASGAFDAVIVDAPAVNATAMWLAQNAPNTPVYAVVEVSSPNVFFDVARALADGATVAFLSETADWTDFTALDNFNAALSGGVYPDRFVAASQLDTSGRPLPDAVIAFTRMADSRSVVVPRGDTAPFPLQLPGDRYAHARQVDGSGVHDLSAGSSTAAGSINFDATAHPFAVVVDRVLRRHRAG